MAVPRPIGRNDDGPASLTLLRHGESVANVADAEARKRDADRLDLDVRDADVELSQNGRRQADALCAWLQAAPPSVRPTMVLSSPYRRAADTARGAVSGLGLDLVFDERLRERDVGLFTGLTARGIREQYGEEATRRSRVGAFYYQPPSGESWADVVLRVRSLLADLRHGFAGTRLWVFSHQAVIMSFRYVLEGLDEERLLEIDRTAGVGNASLTTYLNGDGGFRLERLADSSVVDAHDAAATREPPVPEEARTNE